MDVCFDGVGRYLSLSPMSLPTHAMEISVDKCSSHRILHAEQVSKTWQALHDTRPKEHRSDIGSTSLAWTRRQHPLISGRYHEERTNHPLRSSSAF